MARGQSLHAHSEWNRDPIPRVTDLISPVAGRLGVLDLGQSDSQGCYARILSPAAGRYVINTGGLKLEGPADCGYKGVD